MKVIAGTFIFAGLFLASCENQVDIQSQPYVEQPIIYCLINPDDSIHTIRIERMFSGIQPPAVTSGIADSIFFEELKVTVALTGNNGEISLLEATRVEITDQESGYFGYQKHYVYQFHQVMKVDGQNKFTRIGVNVEIPGRPAASAECGMIRVPKIWAPKYTQQFIYLVRDRPFLIQWSGGSWNEVDIRFEIKEMYADSIATKFVQFQKINDVRINGQYYEVRIPYELVVQGIERNFTYRKDIIRRYFGPVWLTIHTGTEDYANYIRYLGGINDFNENPYSNIKNGLGLLTSRSTVVKSPMELDQESRMQFASDPVLIDLGFIEY